MFSRSPHVLALLGVAFFTAGASAQYSWLSPVDGVWTDPARWSPTGVPNFLSATATLGAGAYSVQIPTSIRLHSIAVGAGVTIRQLGGVQATFYNSPFLDNGGTYIINADHTSTNGGLVLWGLDLTLSGAGTLALNGDPANLDSALITNGNLSPHLINAATHTIRGVGRIQSLLINNGTVNADVAGQPLVLASTIHANNATMKATNGGILRLDGVVISQSAPATLYADAGSALTINGGTVVGGSIGSYDTGLVTVMGDVAFQDPDGSLDLFGQFTVDNGSSLTIQQTSIVNNASLVVNTIAGPSFTTLVVRNGMYTFSGSGEIRLNARAGALDTARIYWWDNGDRLINGPAHTIRGTGQVYVFMTNNGTVLADVGGAPLRLYFQPKLNNGLLKATGGGTLDISCGVTQGAAGRIVADDASAVLIQASAIDGGRLESVGSGDFRVSGSSRFGSIASAADVRILPGSVTSIAGGVTYSNEGTLTVSDQSAATATLRLTAGAGEVVLTGPGTLLLMGNPTGTTGGIIAGTTGTEVLRNRSGHTLAGTGRLATVLLNDGTISPGQSPGNIGHLVKSVQPLTCSATSRLIIDLESASSYDTLAGDATLNLGGELRVSAPPNLALPVGSAFPIIQGSIINGRFAQVHLPPPPAPGRAYTLRYDTQQVLVRVVCAADFNLDGTVDMFDYLDLVDALSRGETAADYNQDAAVDLFDYLDFVQDFSQGCA